MSGGASSDGWFSKLQHSFALDGEGGVQEVDARDLAVCRQISALAVVLIFAFWVVYRLTDSAHIDPLWGRILFATVPGTLVVGTYVSAAVRQRVIGLWRFFLYVTVTWIAALTAVNRFDSSYAIGLLFVVAATSAGFGVGLQRRRPALWFLSWATLLPAALLLGVESPRIDPFIYLVSLVSLTVIFYMILDRHIRAEETLRARREEAEAASRLKSTILGNLSHEFRTPLTSILGFSEMLKNELSGEKQDRAELIYRSGARLQQTLDTLVALSRLKADRANLASKRIDVTECVARAVEPFEPAADEQEIDLVLDCPESTVEATLNPEAVERIVAILTDNAIKFTDAGQVEVRVRANGDVIVLGVEDTGIGMDEETRARLFEPFRQASEGKNRTEEGLGLGLTLVGQLVEMLDGEIDVDSEPEMGTEVQVRLPREAAWE